MDGLVDEWMDRWMDGRMDGWMDGLGAYRGHRACLVDRIISGKASVTIVADVSISVVY